LWVAAGLALASSLTASALISTERRSDRTTSSAWCSASGAYLLKRSGSGRDQEAAEEATVHYAILETTGKVRRGQCDPRDIDEEINNGILIALGDTEQDCDRILEKDPNGKPYWY